MESVDPPIWIVLLAIALYLSGGLLAFAVFFRWRSSRVVQWGDESSRAVRQRERTGGAVLVVIGLLAGLAALFFLGLWRPVEPSAVPSTVAIERLRPDVEGDGLTEGFLRIAVELRLRQNGIPIGENALPNKPYLYVNVNTSRATERNRYAFGIGEANCQPETKEHRHASDRGPLHGFLLLDNRLHRSDYETGGRRQSTSLGN